MHEAAAAAAQSLISPKEIGGGPYAGRPAED